MESKKMYLYPAWLRIWHGINAICIIMLIVTGVSLHYADMEYPFMSFGLSITLHNIFGVIATISYLFFFIFNRLFQNGLQYRMKLKGLMNRLIIQGKYYMFGYFKGEPKPFPISEENKFNPLQRVSYTITMYILMPVVIITGFGLLYPEVIVNDIFGINGIHLTAVSHAVIGYFISLFLVIHIYVASVGKHPLKNYKSIITGYHEHE
jgi:thiosulfate reductase cytochrome b subunit